MTQCLISLCMIVRNEEEDLARCLESVKDIVDEMIIVDTGSTDNTVKIARRFGARVYHHEWKGHFAEARNIGLSYARGKWLLWMDADEELQAGDGPVLREHARSSEDDVLLLELVNYVGSGQPDPYQAYTVAHHRMFRNGKGFQFDNAIHEQLNVNDVPGPLSIKSIPVRIYHYGYLEEVVRKKGKSQRNIALLSEDRERNPDNPWTEYHLASEYYRATDYVSAFQAANRSISLFLSRGELPPSLVYLVKYRALLSEGLYPQALPGIQKALELYPDYVDLHLIRGVMLLQTRQYDEALVAFKRCLELGEDTTLHLSQKGSGSYYAHYYQGVCWEMLGKDEQALQAYRQAIELYPYFAEAKEKIAGYEEGARCHKQTSPISTRLFP